MITEFIAYGRGCFGTGHRTFWYLGPSRSWGPAWGGEAARCYAVETDGLERVRVLGWDEC